MATEQSIQVTVMYSPGPRKVHEITLQLPPRSTLTQALEASGLLELFPGIDLQTMDLGIWGRKVGLKHLLRDQDRVEIYRPLTVDPKVARRERFSRQGARTAGLFTKKRPGAKAGY